MNRPIAALALVLLLVIGGAFAASAQDEPTPAAKNSVSVEVAGFGYDVDGDEPLTACVTETRDDVNGSFATLMVFGRQINEAIVPIGVLQTRSSAAIDGADVGDCFVLVADDDA